MDFIYLRDYLLYLHSLGTKLMVYLFLLYEMCNLVRDEYYYHHVEETKTKPQRVELQIIFRSMNIILYFELHTL